MLRESVKSRPLVFELFSREYLDYPENSWKSASSHTAKPPVGLKFDIIYLLVYYFSWYKIIVVNINPDRYSIHPGTIRRP